MVDKKERDNKVTTVRLYHWVILGLVTIIALLVIGVSAVIVRANTSGENYQAHAKAFLLSVKQAVASTKTPGDAKKALVALTKPQFDRVAFGDILSAKYRHAIHDKSSVERVIGTVTARLNDYEQMGNFENNYQPTLAAVALLDQTSPASPNSNAAQWIAQYQDQTKKMLGIVKLSQVSPEAQQSKSDLITQLDQVAAALNHMSDAVSQGSQDAFNSATDELMHAANRVAASYSDIQTNSPGVGQAKLIKTIDSAIASL